MTLRRLLGRGARLVRDALVTPAVWLPRPRPYATGYGYQQQLMHQVPPTGVILDLGSGHNPFPCATILSERYLGQTHHRRDPLTRDHRPLVVLDVHQLPFADKSIDYLYCSHVLEHVERPEVACAEIMRVAKAGYIETPTFMKDMLFSWGRSLGHRWHVVSFAGRLVFFEYDARQARGTGSRVWERTVLGPLYHPNQDLYFPNQDLFNATLEWRDRFEVTVFRLPHQGATE